MYNLSHQYLLFLEHPLPKDSRHINDDFGKATELFLGYADKCAGSQLYMNDAVEFAALYLAELADRHYEKALEKGRGAKAEVAKAVEILEVVDKLLATHPDYSLRMWVDYARAYGADQQQKDLYEANAKRLITTWGGWQEDYAARFWAGLVGDYYIPRIQKFFSEETSELDQWEENWIMSPWTSSVEPYENPPKA